MSLLAWFQNFNSYTKKFQTFLSHFINKMELSVAKFYVQRINFELCLMIMLWCMYSKTSRETTPWDTNLAGTRFQKGVTNTWDNRFWDTDPAGTQFLNILFKNLYTILIMNSKRTRYYSNHEFKKVAFFWSKRIRVHFNIKYSHFQSNR